MRQRVGFARPLPGLLFLVVAALAILVAAPLPAARAAMPGDVVTFEPVLSADGLAPGTPATLALVLDIQRGYHTQSHEPLTEGFIPLRVTLEPVEHVRPLPTRYPPAQVEEYPALGRLSVFTGRTVIFVPLEVKDGAPAGPVKLKGTLSYQACDDTSCFPPINKPFELTATILSRGQEPRPHRPEVFATLAAARPLASDADAAGPPATGPSSPASTPTATKALPPASLNATSGTDWSFPFALSMAFLAGVIFNLMPCVLPVLPLKAVGFFEAAQHSRARAVEFGLWFSLGVVAFFTVIAVFIFVLKSITWSGLFTNVYFVWFLAALLAAMALGLFGLFELQLPASVYSFTPRHDTALGNFLFGILTAVLATPCTAPLLPALMTWAVRQPWALAVSAVTMVGVGMASPYLVLSAFPELARRFPRTGPLGELVKQMLGFLLLIAAAYYASSVTFKAPTFWAPVLAVTAIAALFLVARTVQVSRSAAGVAVASTIAVGLLSIVLYFSSDLFRPPASTVAGGGAAAGWVPYTPAAFEQAVKSDRVVLVKFTANWCGNCQVIERNVYTDPAVWQAIAQRGVVTLKADMTHGNPEANALLLQLNPAGGIPITAIYSPRWAEPLKFDNIYTADTLLRALEAADPGPGARPGPTATASR